MTAAPAPRPTPTTPVKVLRTFLFVENGIRRAVFPGDRINVPDTILTGLLNDSRVEAAPMAAALARSGKPPKS